ncbi:MAG: L,D-transpeptidase [Anaerolineales bacterium]|nr:L,D-transpeptidase [Anaerolineales bacterium]
MSQTFSRRDFLKLSSAAAVGFGFRDFPPGGDPASKRPPSFSLGRTVYSLRYYARPSFTSEELGYYVTDTVIDIYEERLGDPRPAHNPIWLRTDEGWLHSAYVQPVRRILNQPVDRVPASGMLVQVTMPYTQAWRVTEKGWKQAYRFYYCSTHWATYVFTGSTGIVWYHVLDDRYGEVYAVQAEHLRPVNSEELTPLSPAVGDKHIEVDLGKQRLVAFEGQTPVFTTRIATGYFEGDTPRGEFYVERKQPSRHMASNLDGNEFDLPGVPWVSYISWTGVSLHGTYWHHNYGAPQSHGCINLLPEAAKWVYRWTEPYAPVDEDYVESQNGTRVVVF